MSPACAVAAVLTASGIGPVLMVIAAGALLGWC